MAQSKDEMAADAKAASKATDESASNGGSADHETALTEEQRSKQASALKNLRAKLEALQAKSNEITDYVRGQMLEDAKDRAKQNVLVSLLMALGLGIIIGFILRGLGRGRS